jgi:UrcA family protein
MAPGGECPLTDPKEFVMKIAAVLASSILALAALDTRAAEPSDANSFKVQYADLNLDREAGVRALYERLRVAAKRVCSDGTSQMLISKKSYADCIERAVSAAVAQINRPTLSDYAVQRLRKPLPATRVAAQ